MPRPERRARLLLPLVLAVVALHAPARAEQSPERRLQAVEQAIEDGRQHQDASAKAEAALEAELAELRAASVAAASAVQAREATLTANEAQAAALAAEERAKSAALTRDRARRTLLLMALARLASAPAESLALSPGTPVEALRGAILMSRAVPPIEAQAADLKRDLAALAAVRDEIGTTQARERDEAAALTAEQARIAALIERKAALQDAASQGVEQGLKRQLVLAAQATTLRDLVERLETERHKAEAERKEALRPAPAPEAEPPAGATVAVIAPPPVHPDASHPRPIRPFAQAQGAMVFPVTGELVRRWGVADEYGVASRGLTFETRAKAEVVAPFDGQVLFAGPFKGYGQILIIGHGDGYHSLLAGLDRVDSNVGQWLVAGEPVGTMPDGADKPRLYLELRHNNQPINPTPWLATRVEKVNG